MLGKRTYDDPCGVARALDLVGERWAPLVVRELLCGPKRFADLSRGPGRVVVLSRENCNTVAAAGRQTLAADMAGANTESRPGPRVAASLEL